MIRLILAYFIFNFLAGIILSIQYFSEKDKDFDSKEYLWLLLFPAVGMGKWRHNQEIKSAGQTEFPESWFVCKYMMKVHWGFIISVTVLSVLGLMAFGGFVGSGSEWASDQDSFVALGLGGIADIGIVLVFLVLLFMAALGLVILSLFLILIPKLKMKNIEATSFKQKYMDEARRSQEKQELERPNPPNSMPHK